MTYMDIFNIVAGVASIIGTVISVWTLILVSQFKSQIKSNSRRKNYLDTINKIIKIPKSKELLEPILIDELNEVVKSIKKYEIKPWWWFDNKLKKCIQDVEQNNRQDGLAALKQNLKDLMIEISNR